jgi:hypothetical protein
MIRIPRTYADCYMRIRKYIGSDPNMSDQDLAKLADIPVSMVSETRAAYQTTFLEINEDTEMPAEGPDLGDDSLDRMLDDYEVVVGRLFSLPDIDIEFLSDTYVDKRANSTIFRKYPSVNSADRIRGKTSELMTYILGESGCLSEDT